MRFLSIISVILLFCVLGCAGPADEALPSRQPAETSDAYASLVSTGRVAKVIEVGFRNNKARFVTANLVVYPPRAEEPNIESKFLLPWQKFTLRYPIGTKFYLASNRQLRRVKGGQDLRSSPAILTLRADDNGQIYELYP